MEKNEFWVDEEENRACVALLHESGCSCVVRPAAGQRWTGKQRGVDDLFYLLENEPGILKGAFMADKVVGKAAASLMVLGGVRGLYAGTLSEPARWLLESYGLEYKTDRVVPHIINRVGSDWCPLEKRCFFAEDAEACRERIRRFLQARDSQGFVRN